jgi:2-hydroxychromene-2-carboxylate isomerase
MQRQAEEAEVELRWPSGFPLNTVTSLRITLAAAASDQSDRLPSLIQGFFRAVWVEDRDPQDLDVVRAVCAAAGLDGDTLLARATSPSGKQALRDATSEAVELGVFGAPTWAVHAPGHETGLFWGNDRIELALRAAAGDDRVLQAGLEA